MVFWSCAITMTLLHGFLISWTKEIEMILEKAKILFDLSRCTDPETGDCYILVLYQTTRDKKPYILGLYDSVLSANIEISKKFGEILMEGEFFRDEKIFDH